MASSTTDPVRLLAQLRQEIRALQAYGLIRYDRHQDILVAGDEGPLLAEVGDRFPGVVKALQDGRRRA